MHKIQYFEHNESNSTLRQCPWTMLAQNRQKAFFPVTYLCNKCRRNKKKKGKRKNSEGDKVGQKIAEIKPFRASI